MHPVLFKLGPFTIYSYGFFLASAFLISSILVEKQARRAGIKPHIISNLCLISLISGIIGARLFFIILNLDFFKHNPKQIIMFHEGGLVWYGGLTFALICGFIYLRLKKQPVLSILDFVSVYIALAQSIGRIGCFLNGCCFGKIWPRYNIFYPTQIFSSLIMLSIFIILRILQTRHIKTGNIFLLYLILYSLKRFFIEFIRADPYLVILNLTVFQVISVSIFIVAVISFMLQNRLSKQKR